MSVASILCCLGTTFAAAEPQQPLFRFAAPPGWVDTAEPRYGASDGAGISDGAAVLLFDRQINVAEGGDEYYEHFAAKLLNSVGVDQYSQIGLSVDPGYQTLRIHSLRVVRGSDVIDQRELARITAQPEENDLRGRIYNGRYSIDVLLSDVRAGDVIEYAYTLYSRERLFPGHFAASLSTGWSSPVLSQRIRVRSPLERPLRYRLSDGEAAPAAQIRGDSRELVLEWTNVPPITGDPDRPGWYDPWPYLEVSDLDSWSDVTRLVSPLFSARQTQGRRVADVVEEIRAAGGTLQQQALRALQFVQDKISYASIAIGRGTHEPADPELVLERRFGDCKDKSLLLTTILDRLGIDAQTALVHSSRGRALDDALPTPYAFDHAIVWTRIDGEEYWLDATAVPRYSPISPHDPANFERALLVHAASPELHVIPRPAPGTRRRELLMEFDLGAGIEEPAALEMTTWFRGGLADVMRQVLAHGSPEQRQSDYANYIASYYPGAEAAGPVTIADDKSANVIEVRELYTLPRTFTPDDAGLLEFSLHADELYRYGEPLESSVRQAPLALEYPIQSRQSLVVRLPEKWLIHPQTVTVENPAFEYRGEVSYSARTLRIDYDYQALADHVELSDLARYKEDRRRFYDDVGYLLTYRTGPAASAVAPLPAAALLLTVLFCVWAAIRWGWRYDPEPAAVTPGAPVGIGGWLLLPVLGLIACPVIFAWIVVAWAPFFTAETWQGIPALVNEGWRGTAQLGVLSIMATTIALLIANTLALVLLVKKRTSFPAIFIAFNGASMVWAIGLEVWLVLSGLDTETRKSELPGVIIRDCLVTLFWIFYMLQSRRVSATFVNRAPPRVLTLRTDEPLAAG